MFSLTLSSTSLLIYRRGHCCEPTGITKGGWGNYSPACKGRGILVSIWMKVKNEHEIENNYDSAGFWKEVVYFRHEKYGKVSAIIHEGEPIGFKSLSLSRQDGEISHLNSADIFDELKEAYWNSPKLIEIYENCDVFEEKDVFYATFPLSNDCKIITMEAPKDVIFDFNKRSGEYIVSIPKSYKVPLYMAFECYSFPFLRFEMVNDSIEIRKLKVIEPSDWKPIKMEF